VRDDGSVSSDGSPAMRVSGGIGGAPHSPFPLSFPLGLWANSRDKAASDSVRRGGWCLHANSVHPKRHDPRRNVA
jgi:hypothetical protein